MRAYRYLDFITALFVTVLIISNIASNKVLEFGSFTFDGGTILFPLAYIFGDILTEVYGYRVSRRVIWTGFGCLGLMAITLAIVNALPPSPIWNLPGFDTSAEAQAAFSAALGSTVRIVIASLVAYWAGEFTNSFILAKLKVRTKGQWLWSRTISSTVIGQLVDTGVFLPIAFLGLWSMSDLWTVFVSNYIFKVGIEVIFTPVTYQLVNLLKRAENEDYFDHDTNFNPLALSGK